MTVGRGKRLGLLALCLCCTLLFAGLGVWQIQRLGWKHDLIARVEARIHATAVPAPARHQWSTLDLHDAEYRRVRVRGEYLHDRETLVDAITALGPGAWVLTPLRTGDGIILINRGFVAPERLDPASRRAGQLAGEVEVQGLLRRSEPAGRVLRPNQPDEDRWFSRDVAAIARVRGLGEVAPFFIDADALPGSAIAATPDGAADASPAVAAMRSATAPVGGLTVVRFRDPHLMYAVTWFALAGLCIAGVVLLVRRPAQLAAAKR